MGRPGFTAPATVVALVLLAAGCSAGGTPGPGATPADTGPIAYATGATDLVLQAGSGGGLLPESMRLAEVPDVSIYGDGSAIRLGSNGSGSGDPLLPELIETRVTADGMARILAAAREAGVLGPDRTYDLPDVFDLPTVQFTVTAAGETHRVSAFALGWQDEERFAPAGEIEARRNLRSFYDRLLDLRAWLPAGTVGTDSAYEPAATRVFMTRLVDWSTAVGGATPAPESPEPGQEVRAWPYASLPESYGTLVDPYELWYCAVVGPDDAAALGLDTATWDTRWRAGGYLYQIVARPLLRHESGCPTGS
ncbi:MAG: hypothetical protein ABSG37_12255 [Candidatus Limnocylindrales bacterium]|jgi:hypothetical protein